MKSNILFFTAIMFLFGTFSCNSDNNSGNQNKDAHAIEKRVNKLLAQMTIEEKVRQLDMYNGSSLLSNSVLDTAKAQKEIANLGIGSIHDFYPRTAKDANDVQRFVIENSRLGIPAIFIEEGLHGYCGEKSTAFPVPIGIGSTWNPDLAYEMGRVIASETRSKNVHMLLAPVLGIAREPRWGRIEECYSEDTYLASRIGVSMVKGMQGNDLKNNNAVVAEPKHYGVHSIPAGGRNASTVFVGEREARTTFLSVFEAAVKEGNAQGIMAAYHELDGVPCSENKWLLSDLLRDEWGFDGFVLSDLGAINRLNSVFHTAENEKEVIIRSLKSGMDMQFYDFSHEVFQNSIIEAVNDGQMEMEVLDRAVKNVLRVKFKLGLFDNPYIDEDLASKVYHCEEHQEVARQAGLESITLLKNDNNVLPLSKNNIKTIAVVGDLSDLSLLGGYSPKNIRATTVLEGLEKKAGNDIKIKYAKGISANKYLSSISADNLYKNKREKGIVVEYFNNLELEGTPELVRDENDFVMGWHNLSPAPGINDYFSARMTAYLKPDVDGQYKIIVNTSNKIRYYFNNQLVYDSWDKESVPNNGVTLDLQAGKLYPIKIEFSKTELFARLSVNWSMMNKATNAKNSLLQQAVKSAKSADVAILVLGETLAEVGEGKGKMNLDLEPLELELLQAVEATGTPTVLVLLNGRPLTINWAAENIDAILECWYAGEFAGDAIADILMGDYNPSGRLPVTFAKFVGQLPLFYNHKPSFGHNYVDGDSKPLFPFGHGLNYTTFEYTNLQLSKNKITAEDSVVISVDVTNTGGREGENVVQLYINDKVSSLATPLIELKGFDKIMLKANETKTVQFTLGFDELFLWNIGMEKVVEPGEFDTMIGKSSENIILQDILEVL